jgi:hypothetical protein
MVKEIRVREEETIAVITMVVTVDAIKTTEILKSDIDELSLTKV